MKHRILAWMLAVSLVLTLLPISAMAVEGPVAEVNGTQYEEARFQEAIEAAKDGGTVKLLQDYTLELGSSRLDLTGFKGTFDLGTHKLTLNTTHQMAVYASGAELTVKNGTLAGSSKSYLLYSTNGGSLNMENVTVNYTASGSQPMTVYAGASSSTFKRVTINTNAGGVEVGNGTGTFEDCTFKTTASGTGHPFTAVAVSHGAKATVKSGDYSALYGLYVYSTGGTIDVQGGSVTGAAAAMRADASAGYTSVITASNGTFNGDIQKGSGGTVNIELSGGSYTADPSEYLANGYTMENSGGSYQVKEDTSMTVEVIPEGAASGMKYATFAEAMENAGTNSTIKLLGDVSFSEETAISKTFVIDLNGHDLTGSGPLTVNSTAFLTIKGTGTVEPNIAIPSGGGYVTLNDAAYTGTISNESGSKFQLKLNSGTYSNTIEGNVYAESGVSTAKFDATKYSDAESIPLKLSYHETVLADGWYELRPFTYTIHLDLDGGTLGEDFSTPITYIYGPSSKVNVPKVQGSTVQITRPGWTFEAWYYNEGRTGSKISATSGSLTKSNITSKANADHVLTLYAKWTKVKEAAVLDASGSQLAAYDTLQEAFDAAEAGQTVRLLADVTLADNTPAKLVDKGMAESPVTLDLNGHTISGSNSNTGTTDSSPGGILWLNGSYVTLTDTSEGEKGGVVNTFVEQAGGSKVGTLGLVVKATADHGGAVTVSGGVKIKTSSTSQNTKAVYVQNNANQAEPLTLDIQDAKVTSAAWTVYATASSGYSCAVTVSGGEFTSTGKTNTASSIYKNGTPAVTVKGGTFHNWSTNDWGMVEEGRVICIGENEDGSFAVTVAEQAPDDCVAYVDATDVYPAICLTKGSNLYTVHNIQTPAGRTIHVKKSVSYTFPAETYYGDRSSGDPGIYVLTLDLAEDVTLSGGMALYSADVTVTGAGSLAEGFTWTPANGFAMTADGESDGLYSCRMGSSAAGAVLTKKGGGEIYYNNVASAISAAKQNPGSTVKMLADYKNSLQVQLNKFNGVTADFTLDLNGCTYTYSGAYDAITLNDGAKLTLTDTSTGQNGALVTEGARATIIANSAIAATGNGGTIVIKEGVTVKNMVLLNAPDSKLTVAGTIDTTGFKNYAVSGNGTKGNTEITIKETAKITADPDTAVPAIYHPQSGTLTVEGGKITGYGGIQMCAGTLYISGSPTITASGEQAPGKAGGDGYIPDGAAISIVDRSYPGDMPTVTITGTPTVTAYSGVDAVQAYTWNKTDKIQETWDGAGAKVNISGGTYSTQPDAALLADGCAAFKQDASGNYVVEAEDPDHEHAWSTEWNTDETHHWHECTAGDCDITGNSEKDGYAAHTKDDGTVTKEPTTEETGVKEYKCTECGYLMETVVLEKLEHVHDWSTEWSTNETHHWHACTANDGAKQDEGAHVYDGGADDTCNTCGYVRALDPDGRTYRIDTSVTGGTITPSAEVPEGGSMKVEYAPGDGFTAEGVSVKVDGVDVDAPSYYTFEAVTDDHSIVVVYREADVEPVVTTASIDLVGPNGSWPDTPCITLTDGAVTAVQAAGGIGEAFSVPDNTTLPYWTYKGWTFTAEKDGETETFGTSKTLTQALADWLTAKIGEGGWTLTMDSKTPGVYKPSSGGSSGGGSSSSSTTKTETTKNPDGSTTTTVTDTKTGTVAETVKTAEGVTGTTVTDKKGNVTEVKAAVPADVAKDAAASGETVTLPVEVPAVKDADDAAEISVTVPKSAGAVKVEIPVEKVTPGTVAVIVKADGTEEIVKTSVTTAEGVALTVEGSATVKVIDNSKEFVDVHPVDHWATASIDFVASREIFAGTTANTFTPEAPTTRGQLMTVLARLDGEEASGSGAIQKGMGWAVEKGVSDGSNPGGTITRQQLAAMLYRYAGSPATDYELTHSDAHKVSDYAVDAMRWAVANGIITGKADGTLDPHGLATRAQVATMMARYCAKIG